MYISYDIYVCMYLSFFLSTNACLGIFNSVWNVVLEFSSVFTWFPERGFSPGRENVWFPLCFPPVVVECVDADSLHLQFVAKMLVKWITLSVSREENSSGLFIGIVYFVSLNADCMPLILFFILCFFLVWSHFPVLLLFRFTSQSPLNITLFLIASSFRKNASQSCHRELHTLFCLFCALIYQKCFQYFHAYGGLSLAWRAGVCPFLLLVLLAQQFSQALLCTSTRLSPTTLRDGTAENRHFFLYLQVVGSL